VEANQFEQYFKTQLRMRGSYDGIFYPKSRAKTMNDWDRTFVDGCAIFFKSDRFKLEEKHLIEFNQVALARPSLRKHKDMYNRVMTRDNIAVACRLTHLETNQNILIGTVHIHWDPSHRDVKLVQTIMLVEEMERLLDKHPQSALILCGDFNALQDSGVGDFLENGAIGPGHEDFGPHTYEPYSTEGAHHTLNLKNSYGLLSDEPLTFTNFTPDFIGIIDYIWHRPNNLTVTGLLGSVPPDYTKQFVGFPTQHMPSDHIPLLVEFKLETSAAAAAASSVGTQQVPAAVPTGEYHQTSYHSTSASVNSSNLNGRRLYSRNKSAIS
jgi:CCR4-NOT transcription complex subunit 6